ATRGSQEGIEEGTPVRAHQELSPEPRTIGGHRRRDRRPDGEQGTSAARGVTRVVETVSAGHLLGPPGGNAESSRARGAHEGTAVSGGSQAQHPGPFEDDEVAASARSRGTFVRRSTPLADVLGASVRAASTKVGVVVDVYTDPEVEFIVGIEVLGPNGRRWFLPWV